MAGDPDGRIGGFSLLTPEERIAVDSWGEGPAPEPFDAVPDFANVEGG